ncbi:hypothetical protein JRO89_XS03G0013900 [Xanthoceras sorbifolium]|uniref:NAC domain-containing protein n=1 Tax=Xanthoceras sorbifolium TaxID=99658 RepID=A0ABQ8I827_9ROSI|nr:hypothetical protein JRO89_XS03G0013900 [Xanthoceras sorbifolium]
MMPTGFRFNPTDEELIEILERKVYGQEMPLHGHFIVERNLYDHEPQHIEWDNTLSVPDNERYCYCMRGTDSREVSGRGWWKATGHVKKIYASNNQSVVAGYKRPLTFHRFKDNERNRNKAIKTNWLMHEYSLHSNSTEWRLCKIKYKGKPSAQEEMENIRKAYQLSNYESGGSSSMEAMENIRNAYPNFVGEQQALQNLDNNNYYMQNMQMEAMDQQVLQYQPTLASNDPFETQFNTNYYVNHDQLEQPPADSPEQPFPSLWSWQN